jgi:hypothetical protein
MRMLLAIPLVLLAVVVGGSIVCAGMGNDPHVREMTWAGGIGLLGAMAGVAPVIVLRHSTQTTVAQAGLAGSVIQMMLTLALAMGTRMAHAVGSTMAFTLWLLAFYWALLAAVVTVMVALVKGARPQQGLSR